MIIYEIVILLNVFVEVSLLEVMADAFFQKKEGVRRGVRALGFSGLVLSQVLYLVWFGDTFWLKVFFVFLVDCLYLSVFYRARIRDSLACISFYYSVMASMDFSVILLLLCVPYFSADVWMSYAAVLFVKFAELGVGMLIRKLWRRGNKIRVLSAEIRRLMFFSGILIVIGAFLREYMEGSENIPRDILVLLGVIIVLSEFALLYLLLAVKAEMQRNSLRDAARQNRMQLELYKSKQELYQKQGKRIHDYKNHLLTIGYMLERNQKQEALTYIRGLTGSIARELDFIYTNHPIADAILNLKKQEAADKEISINFLCSDLRNIRLKEDEIIILLGNLLDNAIEASMKCAAEKSIQVRMVQEEKQLVIVVKNTCERPLRMEDGKVVSTKEDSETHGYGLCAVRDIADRYDGSFTLRQTGEYVKAAIVIPES